MRRINIDCLELVPRHREFTARELQELWTKNDIKRSIKSVQRFLEEQTDNNALIRLGRKNLYTYKWNKQAKGFSFDNLNENESLLLLLAKEHLSNLVPASVLNSMASLFQQANSKMEQTSNKKLAREWLKKVRVVSTTQPLLPPTIKPDVFENVSSALYNNLELDVDYTNAEGETYQKTVLPLGLAQQGPRMYLVCRFEGYTNERSLALHRINSAKATAFTFDRPKDFDLKQYDDDGRFGFGEGKKIQLSFRIDKSAGIHLLETPLSKDQTVKVTPSYFHITATVVDSGQLEWWLRSFGDQISGVKRKTIIL